MGLGIEDQASRAVDMAARAFVEARETGRVIAIYPGDAPADLAQAYAIQDRSIDLWVAREIGGWKVGRIFPPDDARLGAERLSGPVFADTIIWGDSGVPPVMKTFRGSFAAAESEIMLRIQTQQQELPRNDAETLDWIDEIRIGIEIASSPYPRINADGPCVTVSDQGNNAGLVLGGAIPRDRWAGLTDIEVASFVDDECVGRKTAATMLDGPLGAVRFLLSNLRSRGIEISPGLWVSSGAITGVHPIAPGQTFRAEFAGVGDVECKIAG